MRKLAGTMFAAVVSLFAIMLVAPAAQAYPAPGVVIHVNHTTVVSGKVIVINAHAKADCDWSATLFGDTETGSGSHFHAVFTAPSVQHKTTYDLTVTCDTGNGQVAGHAGQALMPVGQVVTRHITITVLPAGTAGAAHASSGSALPSTGGPNAALLGGAGALILVGGGTVFFALRRRHAHA
jgi:LPXTG-motif cell wall-anchored protein